MSYSATSIQEEATELAFANMPTMTSLEIAALADKQHTHVCRDIRVMAERLEADPNLHWHYESTTYIDKQGKQRHMYRLGRDGALTLVTGYDPVPRMRIIKRWQELETKTQPEVTRKEFTKLLDHVLVLVQGMGRLTDAIAERKQLSPYHTSLYRWINERCTFHPNNRALSGALYADWQAWCRERDFFVGTQRRFCDALVAKNLGRFRNSSGARGFVGIDLRD